MNEPLPILRASTLREAGLDASTLRRRTRLHGPGRLVRAGPNAFVDGAAWDAAGPRQRYVTRVYARLGRLGQRATASHASAAAVHGLPSLGGWSMPVHATVPESMYRARTQDLVLHTRPVSDSERVHVGHIAVTTVPRTVVDVAMTADLRTGVVLADAALRTGVRRDDLWRAVHPNARGRVRAAQVLEFADGRSGSPAESFARVVFRELGLPEPVLQQEFVVEIDGRAKYTQERYLAGRDQTEVFLDEKRNHARLLTVPGVRVVLRIEWRELFDLDALSLRFRAAGLPCAVRPVRSARHDAVAPRR